MSFKAVLSSSKSFLLDVGFIILIYYIILNDK
jgi:hypothetical protein